MTAANGVARGCPEKSMHRRRGRSTDSSLGGANCTACTKGCSGLETRRVGARNDGRAATAGNSIPPGRYRTELECRLDTNAWRRRGNRNYRCGVAAAWCRRRRAARCRPGVLAATTSRRANQSQRGHGRTHMTQHHRCLLCLRRGDAWLVLPSPSSGLPRAERRGLIHVRFAPLEDQ